MSKILYLSIGNLGSAGVIRELKEDGHYIVGADCREEHHGKYLADKFYKIPKYEDSDFVATVKRIVDENKIDYIFGGHVRSSIILQEASFNSVLSSPPESLRIVSNKYKTYEMFPHLSPKYEKVTNSEELYKKAEKMGFPNETLCIKPVKSSGSRGFRILVDEYDKAEQIFYHKTNPYTTIDGLAEMDFPPLLLMEYLKGANYHIDILAFKGEIKKAIVSKRLEERFGFGFSLEYEDRSDYLNIAEEVVKKLELSYNCFIQVMGGKILEVGGRAAGSVCIGLDLVKGAIRLAKGEEPTTTTNKVSIIRYWKEIFVDSETGEFFERNTH